MIRRLSSTRPDHLPGRRARGWAAACLLAWLVAGCVTGGMAFTSDDGTLSLRVPDGWAVYTVGGQVSLGSSQAVLDDPPAVPRLGEAFGSVFIDTADQMGIRPGDTPADVLARFRDQFADFAAEGDAPQSGDIVTFDAADRPAALLTLIYPDTEQIVAVVALGDGRYGFINLVTSRLGASRYEGTARDLAASLRGQ